MVSPLALAPSMKSSVLCRAAAIVRRGPVPCLGQAAAGDWGPRGVSGCGRRGVCCAGGGQEQEVGGAAGSDPGRGGGAGRPRGGRKRGRLQPPNLERRV